MKKYLLMLCCAALCAGFVGCSDDDEDESVAVTVETLTGRWSCYKYEDWYGSVLVDSDNEYGDGIGLYIWEFNADGTCGQFEGLYLSELEDESHWDRLTYTLTGAKLSMLYDGTVVDKCSVSKLTSSELVLAYEGDDQGVKYAELLYFRRIK